MILRSPIKIALGLYLKISHERVLLCFQFIIQTVSVIVSIPILDACGYSCYGTCIT